MSTADQQVKSLVNQYQNIGGMVTGGGSINSAFTSLMGSANKATGILSSIPQAQPLVAFLNKATGGAAAATVATTYTQPQYDGADAEYLGPDVSTSTTPEQTRSATTTSADRLTFPSDIDSVKYYITFRFYERYTQSPVKDAVDKETAVIRLPMPSTLVDTFNMGYSTTALGTVIGGVMQTGMPQNIMNIIKGDSQGTEKAMDNARSIADKLSNLGDRKNILPEAINQSSAILRALVRNISDAGSRAIDIATGGTALNPFQGLFFDGPELRNHNFSFKLSPNSAKESDTLKKIIAKFKERMLPERDGLLFKYPDSCIIELSTRTLTREPIYTMYRSMLKSMSVNYAPNNVPAFFKDGFSPVEVALDLQFGEIVAITRNDIKQGEQDIANYEDAGISGNSLSSNSTTPARTPASLPGTSQHMQAFQRTVATSPYAPPPDGDPVDGYKERF